MAKRTISEFLDNEYREYTKYVAINRACPSMIDGLKTGARKIMHAAFVGSLKRGDTKKITNLAGETMNYSLYQHGDASLSSTIITLSQDFNFNLNPLFVDGQNGTLRSQEAASPRYLYVRHSRYTPIWKTDYDLLNFEEEEGQKVEPSYYLPIIPVVICQRQIGLAPGYSYSCMSYNPIEVIAACEDALKSKSLECNPKELIHPYVRDIKAKNWKLEDGKWYNYGEFKYDDKKKVITITDLPYDWDFDSFEKMLDKYVEAEEIKDWKNKSEGASILYEIDIKKGKFVTTLKTKAGTVSKIQAKFKLKKAVPDDNLWVVDETKKIRHFNSIYELINYFVKFRLSKYADRKKLMVKILEERIKKNDDLVKFIELVCKGKLKLRNRAKADVKADMDSFKLPIELLSTPMSKVTIEERDELLKQNEAMHKELEYIKKTTESQMYMNDLAQLRKDIEKDFK